jgi:hypothetical protein
MTVGEEVARAGEPAKNSSAFKAFDFGVLPSTFAQMLTLICTVQYFTFSDLADSRGSNAREELANFCALEAILKLQNNTHTLESEYRAR